MIFRFVLFALFCNFVVPGYTQIQNLPIYNIRTDTVTYQIGINKQVNIVNYTYGEPHIRFLAIHDNEDTGVKAAFRFIQINGGSITELQYGGTVRNISFTDSLDNFYEIDPNSMFTDTGARGNLDKYGDGLVTPEAVTWIRKLGDTVLQIYNADSLGYIITLHNNTDNAFSIRSYLEGDYLENTASDVFINDEMDTDDLVFVTEAWFFDFLKERNINVVYQSIDAPNDGSLSVFAQKTKIPYVNIEVQHGHVDEHYRLIVVVNEMIKEFINQKKVSFR